MTMKKTSPKGFDGVCYAVFAAGFYSFYFWAFFYHFLKAINLAFIRNPEEFDDDTPE